MGVVLEAAKNAGELRPLEGLGALRVAPRTGCRAPHIRPCPPHAFRPLRMRCGPPGGSPSSVGGANALNPIPILIPCHRVVATGGLGGYSGGDGLDTKRALLDLETRARERMSGHASG